MQPIIRRADALRRGVTDADLRRYCRTGAYRALRPGSYVRRAEFESLSPEEQHRVIAEAVLEASRAPDAVLSHVSAATVHGLAVWNLPLDAVHMTRNRRSGGRSSAHRHIHSAPYDDDEVVEVGGIRVTSVIRTVADLARSVPFEEGVCVADDAARRWGLTREKSLEHLARCPTHPGNGRARRVAGFMDGRSESVGESRSRVVLTSAGFRPGLQREFVHQGNRVRVDFDLGSGVVGEFDGRVKYGRLVPTGDTPADVLWREKLRENMIRDLGYDVVRWTWAELCTPEVIVDRIRRAIERRR